MDPRRSETLWKYGEVIEFLLKPYAQGEVMAETNNDVLNFRQGSAMTPETYS